MSRSGYSEDCENWQLIMWRGRVASSIRGKRGQKMLQDLLAALDEMPVKKLIRHELKTKEAEFCALGALGNRRGVEMEKIDPEDYDSVASTFDIAAPLAQEIVYLNDECFAYCTPEERWQRMRNWVQKQIKATTQPEEKL